MATYSINVMNIARTSANFYMEIDGEAGAGAMDFKIYASDGTTVVKTISASDPGWSASIITVTGLNPATSYIAKLDDYPTVTASFATLTDSPKIATESQWEDLASRVKAKTSSSAPTMATVGRLGEIFIDTTNSDAYVCVAVDSVTPSYTWKQITA